MRITREAELLASLILNRADRADTAGGPGKTPAHGSLDALGLLLSSGRGPQPADGERTDSGEPKDGGEPQDGDAVDGEPKEGRP